jgi:curli biogenesis system outer membrane secretion channel CsgG
MRKLIAVTIALLLPAFLTFVQAQPKQLKKRIAVFGFEDKTDHAYHWWTGQPVGQGMSDMLITSLVESGKFTVYERTELEKVMQEQNLGQSGAVTQETAAQVGKLLGVELAVFGAVSEFGYTEGGFGGNLPGKSLGLGIKSSKVTVGIDVRFVNTTTGEIILSKNVRKEKSKKGLALSTADFSFDNRHDFDESIVGKATREAIDEVVQLITDAVDNIPWQGKIIKADASTIFINAGAASGVNVGDEFVVYRAGEELIDPDTGLSLGSTETKVGTIKVTNNNIGNGKASQCTATSGSGFERNDIVRVK